jgi:hypothetical protein
MKLERIAMYDSAFCSIGCITKKEDVDTLWGFLEYNRPVINRFSKIIVAHTKTDNITQDQLINYNKVWLNFFGERCIIINRPNHGHTFGFTDLDRTVIAEAKRQGFKWIWKSTNDVLLESQIFNIEMDNATFLYFQGHGFTGLNTYYQQNIDTAVGNFKDNGEYEYFFPQTNFYIIKSDIDFLIDPEKFNELYNKCINDTDYKINKTQTEYKYLLCECVLRDCVYRNKLKCKHLIGKESYRQLLETILMYKIADSSHKNIFFKECGVCHFHFPNEQIIEI